jgi:hypothetical protein
VKPAQRDFSRPLTADAFAHACETFRAMQPRAIEPLDPETQADLERFVAAELDACDNDE